MKKGIKNKQLIWCRWHHGNRNYLHHVYIIDIYGHNCRDKDYSQRYYSYNLSKNLLLYIKFKYR